MIVIGKLIYMLTHTGLTSFDDPEVKLKVLNDDSLR